MDVNTFEFMLTPYTRLAQANVELLKRLPQISSLVSQTYEDVRDEVADSQEGAPGAVAPASYADLWLQMMGNWMAFWTEVGQALATLSQQSQKAWLEPYQDATAEATPGEAAADKPRRVRAAA